MTSVSLDSLKISEPELKADLKSRGFEFSDAQHAYWRAKNRDTTVTLFKSGKILVQGKDTGLFSAGVSEIQEQAVIPQYESWIGTDESGKGDYFGPLVIAGVLADKNNLKKLNSLGIQDSKKMSDTLIARVAPKIREICVFSVVTVNPGKYNELYEKFKNLNNLLAWGHARAIENILEKRSCAHALSDKFGNESLIKNALMKKGRQINLEQRTKAEDDIAVAAASVLARDEFVQRLKQLSNEYGISLSKGVSPDVIRQARTFAGKYGVEKLKNIAKLHFKTTQKI